MRQNLGLSTLIIAIVIAVRGVAPTPPAAPPAGRGEATKTEKPKPKAKQDQGKDPDEAAILEGPWLATRAFFHTAESQTPDCVETSPSCRPQWVQYFGIPPQSQSEMQFLIATVADPLHSRLSLFTDSSIQAIEDAAQATGWLFANEWLPWIDSADPEEKDPAKRRQEREDVRGQEKEPGILIFRRQAATPVFSDRVLVVFLVGETPTAGVNPQQFQHARAYMRAIHEPGEVLIQGPTFSGSFYSLDRLLTEDRKEGQVWRYRVRSGTATSFKEGGAFSGGPDSELRGIDFRDATAHGNDQERYFRKALGDLGIQAKQAAVLVEDESAYGQATMDVASGVEPIRVFRFPREISYLRNAYKDAVAASKSGANPPPDIEFSIKDPETGEDSIPIFSGAQSPLSQNGVVSSIANAIQRDGIRLVWVETTNVLDALFLANVLKRQCPDTRLLLSHADVLLVQAAQSEPLIGTLVLASYPMFSESNNWMLGRQKYEPVTFPDANSEGVYNATILLLTSDGSDTSHLADYHWHDLPHPPTWLLTLDHQGFLPVNVFPHSKEEEQHESWFQPGPVNSGPIQLTPPPGIWNAVSTVVAVAGLALAWWVWWISSNQNSERDARFSIERIGRESGWRHFHVFGLLLAIFCIGAIICMPALRWEQPTRFILLIAVICIAAVKLSWSVWNKMPDRSGKRAVAWTGVCVVACIVLWCLSCAYPGDRSRFFAFRARELRFGSSPIWPLVTSLSALGLFQFVHLTRCYFAACQRPPVVTEGLSLPLAERLRQGWESFNLALESSFGLRLAARTRIAYRRAVACEWGRASRIKMFARILGRDPMFIPPVVLIAGLGVGFCFDVYARMRSIDDRPYNLLAFVLHLLVIGSLLLTCVHIRLLWHSLQTFLAALGALPIARSFEPVDQFQADRPIWVRRLNLQSIEIHIQALYVLHNMTLLGDGATALDTSIVKYIARLKTKYDQYRKDVENLVKVEKRSRSATLKLTADMRNVNQEIAKDTFEFLLRFWEKNQLLGPELTERSDGDPRPAENPLGQLADLAQQFVALHYSSFLLYAVRQIQNLLIFVSSGFVLLMISLNCYSIQAPQFIGRLLLILFLILATITVTCLVGLEKDPVLSHMGGSDPGKLNKDFYLKIAGYGALPVLSLLASEFPSVSNFLLSWVEPTLEAFK